jgi:hypothetical protein
MISSFFKDQNNKGKNQSFERRNPVALSQGAVIHPK